MPSPFPGMDPFIEDQAWRDFHHGFLGLIQEALVPHLRPRYVVRVEQRVYVERQPEKPADFVQPDVAVLQRDERRLPPRGAVAAAVAVAIEPVIVALPIPERQREMFLAIRERETLALVTVIELLSPANKRPGSDGRRVYLGKREAILLGAAHLVEIDLLRRGARLPTLDPLPAADYYAFVCRARRRPLAEVYPWSLRQPLPTIPIPLSGDDPDVPLDLQALFTVQYERVGYDYSLDYRRPVEPPLGEADAAWVEELLRAAASPNGQAPPEEEA